MWKISQTGLWGLGLIIVLLMSWPVSAATPVTTKYYSLTLPNDWVVLKGPVRGKDNIILQMADKTHSTTATLVVGKIAPGETRQVVQMYTEQLQTQPRMQKRQTEFFLLHGQERGYCIVREDPSAHLLLILTVSGKLPKADFLFSLRTPYKALVPERPNLP
ncbi:MAG: hypothetical protein J5803_05790 [Desulfovibrio sp.]|nr:hypothetical protein [Desulfovibrio sp.]